MSNTAHDLTKRLLNALDSHYNVIDMHAITEIISILEKISITKELLEATRLGKHVNELRRRAAAVASSDAAFAALARRAKLLVKRWRDLVIPNNNSFSSEAVLNVPPAAPAPHVSTMVEKGALQGVPGPPVSPALRLLNPARLALPQPNAYDSDSQDVILVDDEPQLTNNTSVLGLQGIKRPFPESPPPVLAVKPTPIDKKPKRDKKSKKKSKSRSRAQIPGGITIPAPVATPPPVAVHNGVSPPTPFVHRDIVDLDLEQSRDASSEVPDAVPVVVLDELLPVPVPIVAPKRPGRKNGIRKNAGVNFDNYSKFIRDKLPAVGVKKVKTTKELLEDIQSRAGQTLSASLTEASAEGSSKGEQGNRLQVPIIELNDGDSDDDVTAVSIVDVKPSKKILAVKSKSISPPPAPMLRVLESPRTILSRLPPLVPVDNDTEEQFYPQCTCEDEQQANVDCPAARLVGPTSPSTVSCLHNAYIPDVNGSLDDAPSKLNHWSVHSRTVYDNDRGVYVNVVPRFKYLDYSDDKCIKNVSRIPLDRYSPVPSLPPEESETFFRRHYDNAADTPFSEDETDLEVNKLCNGGERSRSLSPVVSKKLDVSVKEEPKNFKPIEVTPTLRRVFKYGDSVLTLPLSIAELNALHEPESSRPWDLSCVFRRTAIDPELSYDRIATPPVVPFADVSKRKATQLLDGEETEGTALVPAFREWHEPLSRTTIAGESLCILPYVVID